MIIIIEIIKLMMIMKKLTLRAECMCVSIKNHYLWWPSFLVSSQANKERPGGESITGWISKWNVLSKLFLDKLFHFTTNLTVQTELPWNWCCTETQSLSFIAIFLLTTCSWFLIHFLPPLLCFWFARLFFNSPKSNFLSIVLQHVRSLNEALFAENYSNLTSVCLL